MKYPLSMSFKIAAIASQIYVTDTENNTVFYVKQKLFKLKENIEIYSDSTKSRLLYTVKADRVIDFSPVFTLYDANNEVIGSVKRYGRKSFWRSTYTLQVGQQHELTIEESNPWVKVLDSLFMSIPFIGLLSGLFLHPAYQISTTDNKSVAMLKKLPAFFEGKYTLEKTGTMLNDSNNEVFAALIMVIVLRERLRG